MDAKMKLALEKVAVEVRKDIVTDATNSKVMPMRTLKSSIFQIFLIVWTNLWFDSLFAIFLKLYNCSTYSLDSLNSLL